MPTTWPRLFACVFALFLILPNSSNAFDTHLSDTAIRNAYFLGQHHDESVIQFLDKYTRYLPQPKTGPYIQSVAFLTPYALAVQQSAGYASGYSAQQAQLDHAKQPEIVRVTVQIILTDSYGPYLVTPAKPRSTSTQGIALRSPDFWRDFRFRLYNDDNFVIPSTASGQPTYSCSDDSGCILNKLAQHVSAGNLTQQPAAPEGRHKSSHPLPRTARNFAHLANISTLNAAVNSSTAT